MSLFKGENSIGLLLTYTQAELYDKISRVALPKLRDKGFIIIGRGTKPKPMLCIHLDTINTMSNSNVLPQHLDYDYNDGNPIISLNSKSKARCLGGDDRAGVWIALQVIEQMRSKLEWDYDIGFFEDEEVGGIGSSMYDDYLRDNTVTNINTTCYIGLDRRSTQGIDEVATYGLDNQVLINKFVQGYNYKESMGSFTDASNLAGEVACVNLSVGYDNEHTRNEILYTKCMERTLNVLLDVEWSDEMYYEVEDTTDYYDYLLKDEDYVDYKYVELLEEENRVLKEALAIHGIDVQELLNEELYYAYS